MNPLLRSKSHELSSCKGYCKRVEEEHLKFASQDFRGPRVLSLSCQPKTISRDPVVPQGRTLRDVRRPRRASEYSLRNSVLVARLSSESNGCGKTVLNRLPRRLRGIFENFRTLTHHGIKQELGRIERRKNLTEYIVSTLDFSPPSVSGDRTLMHGTGVRPTRF